MAEVLVRFTERIEDESGASYLTQACGTLASDGLWDGWVEFTDESGVSIRSPRETKQPNRDALVYWAEGLTATYLEGALRRARDARVEPAIRESVSVPSIFPGPAASEHRGAGSRRSHPVLDPFASYAQGEDVLRQQLSALSKDHLKVLVDAYALPVEEATGATDRELIDAIVRCVRRLAAAT